MSGWRPPAAVLVVALLGAAIFGPITLYKRDRIAGSRDAEWWCTGTRCDGDSCSLCEKRERVACFSQYLTMSDRTYDECWTQLSVCEEERAAALRNVDIDEVGECRVVEATKDSWEMYLIYKYLALVFAATVALYALAFAIGIRPRWSAK